MSKIMQVKQFNKIILDMPKPILNGWHYIFIIPGTDKIREKGWIAYRESDGVIEYARWYKNKQEALGAKL